jgi:DNA-binding transcriptional LysR family regulator
MNLTQLEYILMVYNEKSITKAAEKLYVSQPSLTQIIKRVEYDLGIQLFNRTPSAVLPTFAGEMYIEMARNIINTYSNFTNQIFDKGGKAPGKIRVGTTQRRNAYFLCHILPSFLRAHPNVEVKLFEEPQEVMERYLTQNIIDIAFTSRPHISDNIKYIHMYDEYLRLLIPKVFPIGEDSGVVTKTQMKEIAKYPFVVMKKDYEIREFTDQIFRDYEISPKIILETSSLDVCWRLANSGMIATIIPDTLEKEISPSLSDSKTLGFSNNYYRPISIAYREESYLPSYFNDFIEIAQKEIYNKVVCCTIK